MPAGNSPRTPKVSVVLTTYKRAHLLPATIESILAQTFGDFELVISDDCSPDETEKVSREYERADPRVRYRRGEKNVGMPGNLNAGIQASSGEYVANLHDGDVYEPTLIERWSAALDACPRAAFVFNAYRGLDSNGNTAQVYREPLAPCVPGSVLLEQIFFRRWMFDSPVWGTVMGRRSAYLEAGLFDPRFGFISDVDMWMRLAESYDVAYIAEPLIGLPSREAVPRIWGGGEEKTSRQIKRIFREARIRHYRGRWMRLLLELARHQSFVFAARAYHDACMAKAAIRRVLGGRGRARAL
jgi:glycosyltransferase involved in cell wall biosynthesis